QPVPKGLPPYVSVEASLVPAGISNRYQWKPKAPVEKPGVLSRGQWSRLRGTGWETGAFGLSQPMPKARFLVVGGAVVARRHTREAGRWLTDRCNLKPTFTR